MLVMGILSPPLHKDFLRIFSHFFSTWISSHGRSPPE